MNKRAVKSKKLAYYDVEQKSVKVLSSKLEVARANEIFTRIKDILSENNYDIRNKYISAEKCECGSHILSRFIIELSTSYLNVKVIDRIEERLLKELSIEFETIIARIDKGRLFLILVFVQIV